MARATTGSGSATMEIAVPAETVWAAITDLRRTGEWSPECVGGTWLDGAAGPVLGARFRGHNRKGPLRWSTTCRIVACEPGRELAWEVTAAWLRRPATRWRWVLEPTAAGCRVTESFEVLRAPAALQVAWRVLSGSVPGRMETLQRGVQESLARLKTVLEQETAPT